MSEDLIRARVGQLGNQIDGEIQLARALLAVLDLHRPIEGFNWDNEPIIGCSCWNVSGSHPLFAHCPERSAIATALGVER